MSPQNQPNPPKDTINMADHSGQFAGFAPQISLLYDKMHRVEREYKSLGLEYHCTSMQVRGSYTNRLEAVLFAEFMVNAPNRIRLPSAMTEIQQVDDLLKRTLKTIESRVPEAYLIQFIVEDLARCEQTIASIGKKLSGLRVSVEKLIELSGISAAANSNHNDRPDSSEARAQLQLLLITKMGGRQQELFRSWMEEMREIKIAKARGLGPDYVEMVEHFMADGPMHEMPEENKDEVDDDEEASVYELESDVTAGPGPISEPESGSATEAELNTRFGPGAAFQFA